MKPLAEFKRALHTGNHLRRWLLQAGYGEGIAWTQELLQVNSPELLRHQFERLSKLVERFQAARLIDAKSYSEYLAAPDLSTWQATPVLTRERLRALLPQLRELKSNSPGSYLKSSGGSTGEPVTYLRDRKVDALGDGSTSVMMRIAGCSPGMQRICLSGSNQDIQLNQLSSRGLRGALTKTTLIGGFAPTLEDFSQYRQAILNHPHCTIYGFTSLLVSCAEALLKQGLAVQPGRIAAAWATAEMFLPEHRQVLNEAFGIAFRNFYGSRECSAVGMECAHGVMHVNPRFLLDVVEPDSHAALADGDTGALLVTDLFNQATPMFRYEIGDMAALGDSSCPCGRKGRVIHRLGGRIGGRIPLPSGRYASPLFFNHMLKDYPAIKQFQLVQLATDNFELRYTGKALTNHDAGKVFELTRRVLEQAEVRLLLVSELERSPSGKLLQYRDLRESSGNA